MSWGEGIRLMSVSETLLADTKKSMTRPFNIRDLRQHVDYFVLTVGRKWEETFYVSQGMFSSNLLPEFDIINCKTASTPVDKMICAELTMI